MGSQEALDAHVSVGKDQICTPQKAPSSADPEDGITAGIEDALNDRKSEGKVNCWDSLWLLLFPGDFKIPEPGMTISILQRVLGMACLENWLTVLYPRICTAHGTGRSVCAISRRASCASAPSTDSGSVRIGEGH